MEFVAWVAEGDPACFALELEEAPTAMWDAWMRSIARNVQRGFREGYPPCCVLAFAGDYPWWPYALGPAVRGWVVTPEARWVPCYACASWA